MMNRSSTRMSRVPAFVLALCAMATVSQPTSAQPTSSQPTSSHPNSRDMTIELLDALLAGHGNGSVRAEGSTSADGSDRSVRVLVNDGAGGPVRIGDELVYRFESSRPGYLTAIHVDTHGAATLLYPRPDVEAGLVHSGQAIRLPSASDGFHLAVQPPIGRDLVYAIVTDRPITRADLGIESRDIVVSFEPHQAPALARQLTRILESRSSGEIRIAQVAQQVDGRGSVQYRSADIVGFFSERTRSIRPAKLDLQIQFETNSSTLDEVARRNVEEFARALEDPKLRDMRFKVAGHTDARGSEAHNMGLSGRRAQSVRDYLVETAGIDADRLETEALGETIPLMRDESAYARQMNRRVEFTPLR